MFSKQFKLTMTEMKKVSISRIFRSRNKRLQHLGHT